MLNVQLKYLMFAPTCFGPDGPKHVEANMRYFKSTF